MRALLWAFPLILGAAITQAQPAAREAYDAGRFAEAAELFQEHLRGQPPNPGITLYNLGNCLFRLERYGRALHFYRCARLRRPGDPRLRANIRLCKERLGLDPKGVATPSSALAARARDLDPSSQIAWVVTLEILALLGLLVFPKKWLARGLSGILLAFALLLTLGIQLAEEKPGQSAIALVPQLELRSQPHQSYPVIDRLGEGTELRIGGSSQYWVRVLTAEGDAWVQRSAVGIIE